MSVPVGAFTGSAAFSRDDTAERGSTRSSSSTSSFDDEFTKLKSEREKQRREKVLQKLSRSVSISNRAAGEPPSCSYDMNDTEILLSELAGTSKRTMQPPDDDDKEQ